MRKLILSGLAAALMSFGAGSAEALPAGGAAGQLRGVAPALHPVGYRDRWHDSGPTIGLSLQWFFPLVEPRPLYYGPHWRHQRWRHEPWGHAKRFDRHWRHRHHWRGHGDGGAFRHRR